MPEDSADGFGFRRGCCWGYLFVYENAPEKLSQLDLMVQGRAQLEHSSHIVKACVRYFLIKFLFFHQMRVLQNLWKIFFIPSKKLFSFSKYSNFCNFSLPFHTFHIQKDKWKWNNLQCHELACINSQVQTLEQLKNHFILYHQTWSGNI